MKKIGEYIETGTLRILERERADPQHIFSEIYGVGPKKATQLVEKGFTSIAQLREKQDEVLNDVQKIGLRYYDDILQRIPREEINAFSSILHSTLNKVKEDGSFFSKQGFFQEIHGRIIRKENHCRGVIAWSNQKFSHCQIARRKICPSCGFLI
jgi:5'-3' exonuclease